MFIAVNFILGVYFCVGVAFADVEQLQSQESKVLDPVKKVEYDRMEAAESGFRIGGGEEEDRSSRGLPPPHSRRPFRPARPEPDFISNRRFGASAQNPTAVTSFRDWESMKTDAMREMARRPPHQAMRPPAFALAEAPEPPEVVTRPPSVYYPQWTPKPRSRPLPPYVTPPPRPTTAQPRRPETTFIRPSPSPESSPNSINRPNRINLQTEYFSLPSIRSTVFSSTTSRPSKIPVLVKKLAKRPVSKNRSRDDDDFGAKISPPRVKTSAADHCSGKDIECAGGKNRKRNSTETSGFGGFFQAEFFEFLRGEIWVIPIIVASASLIVVLLIFEIYLISKSIAANPSRRHLFLGQTLMLGLLACCAMAVVVALKPTVMTCSVARIGIGLSYTIIYSTLLVKLVFLISLNSGVYLPATYQCLLLCFAVLIQLVIGIQWLMSVPARVVTLTVEQQDKTINAADPETYETCSVPFQDKILGLLYVVFLILVVVVLAFKSRGVRENYREAMYIGLTMVFTVCIFCIWILAGFIAPTHYGDVCLACGLVSCAAITFVIMFMPKGRQLSAMGREGVYSEDRKDVYEGGSSTQSTGSGGTPSPSFFPIKPGRLEAQMRRDRLDTPPSPRKHG